MHLQHVERSQWLQTELMRVDIETTSLLAAGQTVCDVWGQSGRQKNVYVAKVCELRLIQPFDPAVV
jgi:inosine-uridine nucleoside N-ribohydrolase